MRSKPTGIFVQKLALLFKNCFTTEKRPILLLFSQKKPDFKDLKIHTDGYENTCYIFPVTVYMFPVYGTFVPGYQLPAKARNIHKQSPHCEQYLQPTG